MTISYKNPTHQLRIYGLNSQLTLYQILHVLYIYFALATGAQDNPLSPIINRCQTLELSS